MGGGLGFDHLDHLDHLEADVTAAELLEHAQAAAEKDRDEVHDDLVDQAGLDELAAPRR